MRLDYTTGPSRILIADDNQQNCELLEAYLAGEGYLIDFSSDGEATLKQVEREQPDLILLDIMMPRMSGYEVCERLKKSEVTCDIPIIMVTALNESGDIEKAVNAGADDYLAKPFVIAELVARIRALGRRSSDTKSTVLRLADLIILK